MATATEMEITLRVAQKTIAYTCIIKVVFALYFLEYYYKKLSGLQRPLIRYRFDVVRTILPETCCRGDEDSSEFLSAVAWRPRSNTLLAANSQGIIKLLTLK